MRYLALFAFLVFSSVAMAQYGARPTQYGRHLEESSALMTDAMGQPFYPQQKYNWEGKVFFPDDYTLATITAMNGKIYRNIRAKINLLDNTLLFTDSASREFVATVPIKKVEFENQLTFIKPSDDTAKVLYQLLDSGKITLLKKIFITYKDQTGYGSTMVTRIFEQKYSYYILKDHQIISLDRSKTALLEAMADRNSQLDAYIEQEKLKLRKEEDLIKVFRFYNSL